MYVKERIKNHFLTLLDDKELAVLYFYNRDIVEEFNSDKLIDLENSLKKSESRYNKFLNLYSLVNSLGIESLIKKTNDNLVKAEKDYSKNIDQLDIFKSNLAYLIISGTLKLEIIQVMGYSKEFVDQFLIPYQTQAYNPYVEYYYNENNGRTSMLNKNGFNVILPYTPQAILRKINEKEVDVFTNDGIASLKKIYRR